MPEEKGIALVTGAGGFIGSHLVRRLAGEGVFVRATSKSEKTEGVPENVEWIAGDIRDADLINDISRDVDRVFHLAAAVHDNSPSQERFEQYRYVNVDATRHLLQATAETRSSFVFASTVAVYGPGTGGDVFDESSPINPQDIYAKTKLEAEKIVLGHPDSTVLRFPAVFGEGMRGNLPRLVAAIERGYVPLIGDGANRKTFVHVEDAVSAMILASGTERARMQVYNVTDGGIYSIKEVIDVLSGSLEANPRTIKLPVFAARFAAGVLDAFGGMVGQRSGYRISLEKFLHDSAVSGELIKRELGFEAENKLGGSKR